MSPLLSPPFLFRFSMPCRHSEAIWPAKGATDLGPDFTIPNLGQLEEQRIFGELQIAWNEEGIGAQLRVSGKSQPVWCRENRVEDSDGLNLWIDTRDTHNVHRASRFCHHFVFLPAGTGSRSEQPVAHMLPINRARELCKPVDPKILRVSCSKARDGYSMRCWIPSEALTGYDPTEYPKLGFFYAIADRELGIQTFSVGSEFPYEEDPSLWGTLELKR